MPFTLSHPAAALPFRRWLPLEALAIGSMAPDFLYFAIPEGPGRAFGHTPIGLMCITLPVGLAVSLLVRHFVLPTAAEELALPGPTPRPLAWSAAGVLVGALTHVGWDLFTHDEGAQFLPFMTREVVPHWPLNLVMQYACSLLGMGILALYLLGWSRKMGLTGTRLRRLWAMVGILVAGSLLGGIAFTTAHDKQLGHPIYFGLGMVLGVGVAATLTTLARRLRRTA